MKLGDRMKANYESRTRHHLTRRMPVIIRVDGRAFHTYTRGMDKPFDNNLILAMRSAATILATEIQGFKLGYVQSDEASFLLTDYDTLQTDAWFDYSRSKVETISASVMTASFNRIMGRERRCTKDAYFDARAFNIPREEVANYFLWRAKDWERNSLSMYCYSFFSHKQLHGKSREEQHELLYSIGKNWTNDLTDVQKNGTWILPDYSQGYDILPEYTQIASVVDPLIYLDKE